MKKLLLIPFATMIAYGVPTWKPLFNGKAFDPEWKIVGDKKYWSIDPTDSSIAGYSDTKNPEATMLFTKATYDQFTVKYSYRLKAGCSGFFFRAKEAAASPYVTGCQVEAKFDGGLKEFGSLYCHPTPGWVRETDPKFVAYAARAPEVYQDVVLTVKSPYVYVNINGKQAIGAGAAGQAAGGKAAWTYSDNAGSATPGVFGLQIHELQPKMDIHFKNIMILTGCGDTKSPKYDGATVAGMPEQLATYQDDGSCATSSLGTGTKVDLRPYFGAIFFESGKLAMEIRYPGEHSLNIINLNGKSVFSGTATSARTYRINRGLDAGIYFAKLSAGTASTTEKIVIP
ncbi:MAG: hypothetical protein JWO30_4093 [Fibrobacteres bacterium]|nr:hypothetical protein [Fibrobacterota bacterium]